MSAYVYLLEELPYQAGESGPWTKIGFSINPPEWRIEANLKRGNPRTLRLSAVYEFNGKAEAYGAEQLAHAHFHLLKHAREWFKVSGKEVAGWLDEQGFKKRAAPS